MIPWFQQNQGIEQGSAVKDQTSMGWNDQVFLQPLHVAFIGISIMRQIRYDLKVGGGTWLYVGQ